MNAWAERRSVCQCGLGVVAVLTRLGVDSQGFDGVGGTSKPKEGSRC